MTTLELNEVIKELKTAEKKHRADLDSTLLFMRKKIKDNFELEQLREATKRLYDARDE